MNVSVTAGKCLQIPFTYRDYPMWIGADYYKEKDFYAVYYKVGLDGAWFATRIDYEIPGKIGRDASVVNATDDQIASVILKYLEQQKGTAAERYLRSAFSFVDMIKCWQETGNVKHAEKFKSYLPYHPVEGVRDSCLVRIQQNANTALAFCHKDETGPKYDLMGSFAGTVFIKAKEITMPNGDPQEIAQAVLEDYSDDHHTLWMVVRSGEVATDGGTFFYQDAEHAEQMYGRLNLWDY